MGTEDTALRVADRITEVVTRDTSEVSVDPEPTIVVEESGHHDEEPHHLTERELGSVTSRNLFQHPLVHPLTLKNAFDRYFGLEWQTWHPETVLLHLQKELGGGSWVNLQKLLGVQAVIASDAVERQWENFLWVTMALNGIEPDVHLMQVPVVPQCALAVSIMKELRSPTWSSEVIDFIATVHQHDCFWTPVTPLEFVKLDRPTDAVDFTQVDALWPRVKLARLAPAGETPEAIQLQKMLTCYEYVADWKKRLAEQEGLINHARPRR